MSRPTMLAAGAASMLLVAGLAAVPAAIAQGGDDASPIRFEERAEAAGVRFVHSTRDFGERNKADVLEMFTEGGSAVAVGDFDGDGLEDLFLTDSDEGKVNLLMHNRGDGTFVNVAEAAGVTGGNDDRSIVADGLWIDYDNDGNLDLLVGRFGTPILYRHPGPTEAGKVPRFVDVSAAAGLTAFGNTIAVIAFDADADGYLDLLFANYFKGENLLHLTTPHVLPEDLDRAENGGGVSFWQNVAKADAPGGRAFVDRTKEAGFAHHTGWSLDIGHADLDNDGDQDVYLAGDYGTDRLF
ncbi:MAG: VCBS repeat-containing protein, partial [Acidobacteriota bacterium]